MPATIEVESLESQAQNLAQHRRETALAAYVEIINRSDHPQPKDAEKILALLDVLGLAASDVAGDAAAVKELRHAKARIVDPIALERLGQAIGDAHAKFQKESAAWELRERELQTAISSAESARDSADRLNRKAREVEHTLRKSHPRIFGEFEAPAPVKEHHQENRWGPVEQPPQQSPSVTPFRSGVSWPVITAG